MYRWLAVMLLFSGCAFGLSGPDPDRPRSQEPKCDTGKGLVALDGVVAATAGIIAISVAGDTEPAVALLPLSIGAIYAAGAIRGNSNVNKCRAAMAEYESYSAARETIHPQLDESEEQLPQPRRAPLASRESDQPAPVQPVASVPSPSGIPATVPVQAPAPIPAPLAATPPVAAAPPVATPPQTAPPPAAKPAKKQPAPKKEPADDWSDFWREVE